MGRFLRALDRFATPRRRNREYKFLLPLGDEGPRQGPSALIAVAPSRRDRRLDHSKRHAGLAAQVSGLCGGVRGAV
jgi:hypothetical protein